MIKLDHLVVGDLGTNCYILSVNDKAIVVDPGGSFDRIYKYLKDKKLDVEYIINTHGHYDHIMENDRLREKFPKLKVIIFKDEEQYLTDANLNFSSYLGKAVSLKKADILVEDNYELIFYNNKIKFLHTPGHTIGSMSISFDDKLISGDTLFYESIGRTDLPGGSYESIIFSCKKLINKFSKETKIYPGHGDFTTIERETKNNPFLK
jgi:glyoxylase-like metal-dependent hydrolase (beta-lactamase superfamily II)